MAGKVTHKWAFMPGMRAGAYSWESSAKAIERLKLASSEIQPGRRGRGRHRAGPAHLVSLRAYRHLVDFHPIVRGGVFIAIAFGLGCEIDRSQHAARMAC